MHPAYVVDIGQAPQEAAEVPGGDAHGIGGQAPMADLAAANRLGSPYHWIIHNLKSAQAGLLHKVPAEVDGMGASVMQNRLLAQAKGRGPFPLHLFYLPLPVQQYVPRASRGLSE
jgi:hypothetical protein